MKSLTIFIGAAGLFLVLGACSRNSDAHKAESKVDQAARKIGAGAYQITRESKNAAKQAGRQLRETGKQLKSGWEEEKRKAKAKDSR